MHPCFSIRALLALAAASVATPSRAYSAEPAPTPAPAKFGGLVALPCDQAPYPKCADLEAALAKDFVGQIYGDLREDAYQGKFFPSFRADLDGNPNVPELLGDPPICPGAPNVYNQCQDESTTNAKGQSCGDFSGVYFTAPSTAIHSLRRASAAGSGSPKLEASHAKGAFLLAAADVAVEVEGQIRRNQLRTAAGSACYVLAQNLFALVEAHRTRFNVANMARCDSQDLTACTSRNYFESGFSHIKNAYLQVARCRITEEASASYRAYVGSIIDRIEEGVIQPCAKRCVSNGDCLKSCYRNAYPQWEKNDLKSRFPRATGC